MLVRIVTAEDRSEGRNGPQWNRGWDPELADWILSFSAGAF
jgi:hypothetical protein